MDTTTCPRPDRNHDDTLLGYRAGDTSPARWLIAPISQNLRRTKRHQEGKSQQHTNGNFFHVFYPSPGRRVLCFSRVFLNLQAVITVGSCLSRFDISVRCFLKGIAADDARVCDSTKTPDPSGHFVPAASWRHQPRFLKNSAPVPDVCQHPTCSCSLKICNAIAIAVDTPSKKRSRFALLAAPRKSG